jgi:hypothetical protein
VRIVIRNPHLKARQVPIGQRKVSHTGYLRAFESACRQGKVWMANDEFVGILQRSISGIDIHEKILISRKMPYLFSVALGRR